MWLTPQKSCCNPAPGWQGDAGGTPFMVRRPRIPGVSVGILGPIPFFGVHRIPGSSVLLVRSVFRNRGIFAFALLVREFRCASENKGLRLQQRPLHSPDLPFSILHFPLKAESRSRNNCTVGYSSKDISLLRSVTPLIQSEMGPGVQGASMPDSRPTVARTRESE